VSVAEALPPGESARADVLHTPLQPDGSVSAKLKVAGIHPELSLSFTVTVKFTVVPEVT
jgi:hypothetical protein